MKKKQLVAALAAAFVVGVAGTAFAANPFVDVPAKHWSYEYVNKLAKAGVVDGYGDGTFRGDKQITRYEMAVITAKAMAKLEKADAEQKAMINKLSAEFGAELQKLGVEVAGLKAKAAKDTINFTGEIRERYEWQDKQDSALRTRARIFMNAPVNADWTFKGRLASESLGWGATASTAVDQAYFVGKAFGANELAVGRQGLYLGQGLVYDTSSKLDGVKATFGNELKVMVGAGKRDYNMVFANAGYNFTKNFAVTGSYLKAEDKNVDKYNVWTAGANYTTGKFNLVGEYGENTAQTNDPTAWYAQLKYLGADKAKPNTYGVWVQYRNAEKNFDPKAYGTLDLVQWMDGTVTPYTNTSDVKGFEFGVEYTLTKNAVWYAKYAPLKDEATDTKDVKYFTSAITWSF